jgi:DNA replication and repair protein RecF
VLNSKVAKIVFFTIGYQPLCNWYLCIPMASFWLQSLKVAQFRNAESTQLVCSPGINAFTGPNGAGKTNILEAIYFLGLTKGYFQGSDKHSIQHGAEGFYLEGHFSKNNHEDQVVCRVWTHKKKVLLRNGKAYDRLGDHLGQFPVVMVSPADRDLILEGSETRRKFMDSLLSQSDPHYVFHWARYHKALEARNALLKSIREGHGSMDLLDLYDFQMEEHGHAIFRARMDLVNALKPVFNRFYQAMAGTAEVVDIRYESSCETEGLAALLQAARPADLAAGYTTVGIHRDDFAFFLEEHPLRRVGSQGQQKTFMVALKLAHHYFLARHAGCTPILLLDDVFDKLDHHRVSALIALVAGGDFGQIFLTDTHPERTAELIQRSGKPAKLFEVQPGGTCHEKA